MVAGQFPRTGEQLSLYRSVLDAAAGRPVTFRTLDVGGDKVLPYMRNVEEENPAHWGGVPSAWGSIVRRCCAARSEAAAQAASGRESCKVDVPDDRGPCRNSTTPRSWWSAN